MSTFWLHLFSHTIWNAIQPWVAMFVLLHINFAELSDSWGAEKMQSWVHSDETQLRYCIHGIIVNSLTGLKTFWWTGCVNVGGWVLWKRTCYTHWLDWIWRHSDRQDTACQCWWCVVWRQASDKWCSPWECSSTLFVFPWECSPTLFVCLNKLHARNSRMLHQDFHWWHYNYIIIILKIIQLYNYYIENNNNLAAKALKVKPNFDAL